MIFECSAIIVVILLFSFTVMRSGKGWGYSFAVLPLIIIPAMHMVGARLSGPLARLCGIAPIVAYVFLDVLSLAATGLLLGIISMRIKKPRARVGFLVACGGFSALLTCVLLVRTVIL
ncbi:MAG: hypothetical protein RR135_05745 [Oscillospiraceae bacterium]